MATDPAGLLSDVMPRFHFRERHALTFASTPTVVFRSLHAVRAAEVAGLRLLFGMRALPARLLGRRPFRFDQNAPFRRFDRAGYAKAAINFRVRSASRPGLLRLETETRVVACDAHARIRFAVYWLVIRAASALLRRSWLRAVRTRALGATLVLLILAATAPAQQTGAARPFEILDNSFLIEESFNQEPGIFQNIFLFQRESADAWELGFTQEWPLGSMKHQLSYSLPLVGNGVFGIGDVLIHYRYQALEETARAPAFAPRLSLILPTGDTDDGLGAGSVGIEINLPVSKQFGHLYLHGNAGFTYLPSAENGGAETALFSPFLGASAIARVHPLVNLMLESVAVLEEEPIAGAAGGDQTRRRTVWVVSPGVRAAWNVVAGHQLVFGAAVPLGASAAAVDRALLLYFSYELPFTRRRGGTEK